jgi:hypothetical protein
MQNPIPTTTSDLVGVGEHSALTPTSPRQPPTSWLSRNHYRGTARVIGLIYIAGMVVGIGGNILIQSILTAPNPLSSIAASSTLLALGVVLWLTAVVGDAAHGVLMFPILKRHSEPMALGYLSGRIMDATFVAVMALLIMVQIPLGAAYLAAGTADTSTLQTMTAVLHQAELYAYEFGMVTLGVSGLILCTVFYRTGLVPRPLAIWGLVGYALFLGGSLLQIVGVDLSSAHVVLGGVWEGFIGVWLIVKGFKPSATVFNGSSSTSTAPTSTSPPMAGATT